MSEKTETKPKKISVPYKKLIIEAIVELKSHKGSSIMAIEKYIKEKHPDVTLKHTLVRTIIKKMLVNNELAPNRYHANSYQIVKSTLKKSTGKKSEKKTYGR